MPILDFEGKEIIHSYHYSVPHRPLLPDESRSLNPTGADDNLIIHGDNLHALKALMPQYRGRVKCVYIDPPYNTGNEGWAYNDKVNSPLMKGWLNKTVGTDDLDRHDKWLCMMWPRLQLLKELLADDGVIFISIDDNEQHHLRMLMDNIFGEQCFKNVIIVRRGTKNVQSQFESIDALSTGHDSILLYGKHPELRLPKLMAIGNDNIPGKWDTFWRSTDRPTMRYGLFGISPELGQWRWSEVRALAAIQNYEKYLSEYEVSHSLDDYYGLVKQEEGRDLDFVRKGPDGTVQYYVPPRNYTIVSDVWMDLRTSGRITDFSHEKHEELLKRIIGWASDKDAIVLDSFAGSGTTAHAVLALNKEDGGNRKFILVECEDYADSITAERVRRVINGVPGAKDAALREGLGGSFTYCTLGEPIDVESMLSEVAMPEFGALASYLLWTSSNISADKSTLQRQNGNGLFYSTDQTDYYLIYEPSGDWLCGNDAVLNRERAEQISAASRGQDKDAIVYGACKYIGQRALSRLGIRFVQLPYEIHQPV